MLPVTSMVTFGGRRALFYTTPRDRCSGIIRIRLHGHSRVPTCNFSSCRSLYASPAHSVDTISNQDFDLFRRFLDCKTDKTPGMVAPSIVKPSINDPVNHVTGPLRRVLLALQHGDTRRLFINIRLILKMEPRELQEAIAALPRATFTQILYALDPLNICQIIDPTDGFNIGPGMCKALGMRSYIDDWGIRKIYVEILACMEFLVAALKATGQALQTEEYTYLLRGAGAAADLEMGRWLWTDMINSNTKSWRETETYDEYISVRFLTRPLYNGYDKTRLTVNPRDLHRSRLMLNRHKVIFQDILRFHLRIRKMYFGLNKNVAHAEDLRRKMRKGRPITRLFYHFLKQRRTISRNLLCSVIIAFARAGCLRYIGTKILRKYFGIRLGRLVYEERELDSNQQISTHPSRISSSPRLMTTLIDAYCLNGEVALAYQLADHLSKTGHFTISPHTWQDLLGWTYVLSAPPVSTAWKLAGMHSKIPDPSAVELLFNAMIEHGVQPQFKSYYLLIQSLIARHHFGKILPLMREAVRFYDTICEEYEEAVFEYAQLVRDGVPVSDAIARYERLRFLKAQMWYDLETICRQFLLKVRSHSLNNPITTTGIPNFIREFRTFIPNPAHYRTSTGYIELFDPIRDTPQAAFSYRLPLKVRMKGWRRWGFKKMQTWRSDMVHDHSLIGHLPMAKLGLHTLLLNTSRVLRRRPKARAPLNKPSASYDEDDDFF